jgi:hypothetical protein
MAANSIAVEPGIYADMMGSARRLRPGYTVDVRKTPSGRIDIGLLCIKCVSGGAHANNSSQVVLLMTREEAAHESPITTVFV